MKRYYLMPTDGRKSFYNKAVVQINDDGSETLYSYEAPIVTRTAAGQLVRHWPGWSLTTGRHVSAFCGLNKSGFDALPMAN